MPEVLGKGVADESIYGEWSRATHHASGEAGYIQPVDLVSRQRGHTGRARPTASSTEYKAQTAALLPLPDDAAR